MDPGGQRGEAGRGAARAGRRRSGARRTVAQRVAELTDRRDAIETDRRLIAGLEAARGGAFESVGWAEMDAAYGLAFRDAGLDVDATDAATAGAWIAAQAPRGAGRRAGRLGGRPAQGRPARGRVAPARCRGPGGRQRPVARRFAIKGRGTGDAALEALHALADDTEQLDAQPAASLLLLASKLHEASDRARCRGRLAPGLVTGFRTISG